jgi:hypothetical protein
MHGCVSEDQWSAAGQRHYTAHIRLVVPALLDNVRRNEASVRCVVLLCSCCLKVLDNLASAGAVGAEQASSYMPLLQTSCNELQQLRMPVAATMAAA